MVNFYSIIDARIWHGLPPAGWNPPYVLGFTSFPQSYGSGLYTSASTFKEYSSVSKVFVCNNNEMRELFMPGTLTQVLNAICPATPATIKTSYRIWFGPTPTYSPANYSTEEYALNGWMVRKRGPIFYDGSGFARAPWALKFSAYNYWLNSESTPLPEHLVYTPSIFASLFNYYQYTDAANIKTLPGTTPTKATDPSDGAYAIPAQPQNVDISSARDPYASGLPFYHLTGGTRSNKDTLNVEATPDPTYYAGPAPATPPNVVLMSAWDWDDPSYCRAMCQALGFTSNDLTP